jgi:hypothetical protein
MNMKNIEISKEWVLGTLPSISEPNGNGTMILVTDNLSDSHWIDLVLDSIGVKYDNDIIDGDELALDEPVSFLIYWKFRIEEIKFECPNLFAEWTKMDLLNSALSRKN